MLPPCGMGMGVRNPNPSCLLSRAPATAAPFTRTISAIRNRLIYGPGISQGTRQAPPRRPLLCRRHGPAYPGATPGGGQKGGDDPQSASTQGEMILLPLKSTPRAAPTGRHPEVFSLQIPSLLILLHPRNFVHSSIYRSIYMYELVWIYVWTVLNCLRKYFIVLPYVWCR